MNNKIPNLQELYAYLLVKQHDSEIPLADRHILCYVNYYLKETVKDLEKQGYKFNRNGSVTVPIKHSAK